MRVPWKFFFAKIFEEALPAQDVFLPGALMKNLTRTRRQKT